MSKYKGDIKGFPEEIVEKMLEYQEAQGNKRDVSIFEDSGTAGRNKKGFTWDETPEGHNFWDGVIVFKNFDLFFEKYPKTVTAISGTISATIIDTNRYFHISAKLVDLDDKQIGNAAVCVTTSNNEFFSRKKLVEHCKLENERIEDLSIISIFEFKNKKDFEQFNQ